MPKQPRTPYYMMAALVIATALAFVQSVTYGAIVGVFSAILIGLTVYAMKRKPKRWAPKASKDAK